MQAATTTPFNNLQKLNCYWPNALSGFSQCVDTVDRVSGRAFDQKKNLQPAISKISLADLWGLSWSISGKTGHLNKNQKTRTKSGSKGVELCLKTVRLSK